MATTIGMPRLSDSMEEGTIVRWLKQDGERVAPGEELVEIETDKATMTTEAEAAGTVRLLVEEGETVPIGAAIAELLGADEEAGARDGADEAPSAEAGAPATPEADNGAAADEPAPSNGNERERVLATPIARRIARDRDLDIATLKGSGPGGRVRRSDVEGALDAPSPDRGDPPRDPGGSTTAKGELTVVEPTRLQQTVARRMAEARATVPDFTVEVDVDMSACVALRLALREAAGEGPVPSYNDFVLKASAAALRAHPRVNAAYRDGRFELYEQINLGFAVAAPDALLVPVIAGIDRLSLGEIARQARRLTDRARAGEITAPELSGGTFTVSNLGGMGVDRFTAVVNPPQAAILAVGALVEKPVVSDGELATAPLMTLRLSCDHRILYGADAAGFLSTLRDLLQAPLAAML